MTTTQHAAAPSASIPSQFVDLSRNDDQSDQSESMDTTVQEPDGGEGDQAQWNEVDDEDWGNEDEEEEHDGADWSIGDVAASNFTTLSKTLSSFSTSSSSMPTNSNPLSGGSSSNTRSTPLVYIPSCFSSQALPQLMQQFVDTAVASLDVTPSAAFQLLRAARWDLDRLLSEFSSPWQQQLLLTVARLSNAALRVDFVNPESSSSSSSTIECPICFEDCAPVECLALSCEHFVCLPCWRLFLHELVATGPASAALSSTCPSHSCPLGVSSAVIEMLIEDEVLLTRFRNFMANSLVDDSDSLAWCPRSSCGKILRLNTSAASSQSSSSSSPASSAMSLITLTCDCNEKFCASCRTSAHAPASCDEALQWRARDKGTLNLDAKFLLEQTKPCPKCGVRIKREGGCLHVVCTQCKSAFCWHCGQGDHHVWECSRAVFVHDKDDNSSELTRYLFYYEKFSTFEASVKANEAAFEAAKQRQTSLVEAGTTLRMSEFLLDAQKVVIDSRRALRWSYVHAYYLLPNSNALRLFEYQQKELEQFTEKLNQLTESSVEKLMSERSHVLEYAKALKGFIQRFESEQAITQQRITEGLKKVDANVEAEAEKDDESTSGVVDGASNNNIIAHKRRKKSTKPAAQPNSEA